MLHMKKKFGGGLTEISYVKVRKRATKHKKTVDESVKELEMTKSTCNTPSKQTGLLTATVTNIRRQKGKNEI